MDIGYCNRCGQDAETVGGPVAHDSWCPTGESILIPKAGVLELLTALRLAEEAFKDVSFVSRAIHMHEMRVNLGRVLGGGLLDGS